MPPRVTGIQSHLTTLPPVVAITMKKQVTKTAFPQDGIHKYINIYVITYIRIKYIGWRISRSKTLSSQKKFANLQAFSLDNYSIIILLLPNGGMDSIRFKPAVPGCHPMYKIRKNLLAFELTFAMTIDNAHGRTILSVILPLSSRPSKFQPMVFPLCTYSPSTIC